MNISIDTQIRSKIQIRLQKTISQQVNDLIKAIKIYRGDKEEIINNTYKYIKEKVDETNKVAEVLNRFIIDQEAFKDIQFEFLQEYVGKLKFKNPDIESILSKSELEKYKFNYNLFCDLLKINPENENININDLQYKYWYLFSLLIEYFSKSEVNLTPLLGNNLLKTLEKLRPKPVIFMVPKESKKDVKGKKGKKRGGAVSKKKSKKQKQGESRGSNPGSNNSRDKKEKQYLAKVYNKIAINNKILKDIIDKDLIDKLTIIEFVDNFDNLRFNQAIYVLKDCSKIYFKYDNIINFEENIPQKIIIDTLFRGIKYPDPANASRKFDLKYGDDVESKEVEDQIKPRILNYIKNSKKIIYVIDPILNYQDQNKTLLIPVLKGLQAYYKIASELWEQSFKTISYTFESNIQKYEKIDEDFKKKVEKILRKFIKDNSKLNNEKFNIKIEELKEKVKSFFNKQQQDDFEIILKKIIKNNEKFMKNKPFKYQK